MTEQALLEADDQARVEALDIRRSFIVQAPAGSGKTELLIQRYLKLLGAVDEPEEVLAITFTRKAAAEMQLRVVDALRRRVAGEESAEPHQHLTASLAASALERSGRLGWDLLRQPHRMRIQTLDSMNASIARAQPLSSPHGTTGARIVTDADLKAVHREAAIATLDWLAESGETSTATRDVLMHVDNNTWLYVAYLSEMLKTRDQWLPFVGSGAVSDDEALRLRERFEANLRTSVVSHLERTRTALEPFEQLAELFDYAASCLVDEGATGNPIIALKDCDELPAADPDDLHKWQGVAELLLLKKPQPEFRRQVTKAQGFPTTDRDRKAFITAMLEALSDNADGAELLHGVRSLPPVTYTDEQWQVLLALFRLLPLAVSELKRLFSEQGIADHTEVALGADAALGRADSPGELALLLDYQLRHILVDEMQDTSSAQYRMLEALTGGWEPGDGRTLFCVGDPMQSVYRFRNAEVGQFLLAREHGVGPVPLEPLLLRRNFRSGENLVSWFNTVFPDVLAADNDPIRGAVSYASAVSARHLEAHGSVRVHPVFGTDRSNEAQVGCRVIVETLAANPDDDLAVLVRGRTQLPELLAKLRSANVPYTAVDIDTLTDLPEIIEILALTRAAVHPADRIAWLGVLRAPWIGLSWSDLNALVHSDRDSCVIECIADKDRLAALSESGRAAVDAARPALEKLLQPNRTESLRDRVEQCWIALGGPGVLDDPWSIENVYRYLDVLEKHTVNGSLRDVADLETILDDERVSNSNPARVQIMTMHRAKGLQFDHVVLYGLGRAPGSGSVDVLTWFDIPDEHGDARKVISPVGPRADVDRDPVHRYIGTVTSAKDKHEQARLLYVACTRAKSSLHLVGNVAVATDGGDHRMPRSDSLLRLLWTAVHTDYAAAFEGGDTGHEDQITAEWIAPVLRRFVAPWTLPPIRPVSGLEVSVDISEIDDEDVEFYWVGTEARVAGTLVHRWLQRISDGRASLDVDDDKRAVTLRWLAETGFTGNEAEPVAKRVEKALEAALSDDRGRWAVTGPGHAELALSGVQDGELVSVLIDRVRIDDDGTHWIVDYKTSSHEGGNLAGFLQAEQDRYRPQLQRYSALYAAWAGVTPRCALYFPLLQEFVELR